MPTRLPTTAAGFHAQFEQAQRSIFRLETLQSYANSGEEEALEAFHASGPYVPSQGKPDWIILVRHRRSVGCRVHRVHVVKEPLSDYLQYELTWGYAPNVDAGEEIGIIPVPPGAPWPRGLPDRTDFWLFDTEALYTMHYDHEGAWLGVELVQDPERIADAIRWRHTALELAVSWRSYIDGRPWLARRLRHVPHAS